jgi:hypothetical protein
MDTVELHERKSKALTAILLEEATSGDSKTELIKSNYGCSASYVTILRNNYRTNNGKIILKPVKNGLIRKLKEAAADKGDRYFKTGGICAYCETDSRYTSTSTCVECMRTRQKKNSSNTVIKEEPLPSLPIFDIETIIASGLNL